MGSCQNSESIIKQLDPYQQQTHIINHMLRIPSQGKRNTFKEQLQKSNLPKTTKVFKKNSLTSNTTTGDSTKLPKSQDFVPLPDDLVVSRDALNKQKEQLVSVGRQSLKRGEVGVVFMAGSQGLNQKQEQSIATYDVGLNSACTLIEILFWKLQRLHSIVDVEPDKCVKIYIMANNQNKDEIKNYLKAKNFFGYPAKYVYFFSQNVEAILDVSGKAVLKDQSGIILGPRGNGMVYSEIKSKNLTSHMQGLGVKYLYLHNIKNMLLKIADPLLLGYMLKNGKDIVATCFQSGDENYGYYAIQSDKKWIAVHERNHRMPEAKWANSGSCLISLPCLKNAINNQQFMNKIEDQFQAIERTVLAYNQSTNIKVKTKCIFYESFYHEIFAFTSNISILQIVASQQMAAITGSSQNQSRKEAISYAKEVLWSHHKQLLMKAGVELIGKGDAEIHPSLFYQLEDLSKTVAERGLKTVQLPFLFK